jgi:adenine-specific DNA-methyltransferase
MAMTSKPVAGCETGAELPRLDLASPNLAEEAKAALRDLFPQAFDEQGQLDFARLRELLAEFAEGDKSRYGLSWAGKQDAKRALLSQSVGTLAPMRGESVEFDETENLIIEGDNLEVLKLLQKAYYGKVKMIYIDPPYNTGNDFIYPDNFREGLQDYLKYSGQVSEEGFRTSSNTETSGRYHSNWLNMMYPRLALARNLLREDGVIFVSIDDHEVHNLRLLLDEVFGEENFVAQITILSNPRGRQAEAFLAPVHEYVVVYVRHALSAAMSQLSLTEGQVSEYDYNHPILGLCRHLGLRARGAASRRQDRPAMFFPIYVNPNDLTVRLEATESHIEEVLPRKSDGSDGRWGWSPSKVRRDSNLLEARLVAGSRWDVFVLDPLNRDGEAKGTKPKTVWADKEINYQNGTQELKSLFNGELPMSYPKPVSLSRRIVEVGTSGGELEIVIDFFAGSGTTAQAVMELNREDGGNRRFILVQLPEPLDPPIKLDDGTKLTTIADICRERVRRAAMKLNAKAEGKLDLGDAKADRGFRAFKLTSSNFKLWEDTTDGDTEKLKEQLKLYAENVLPDRDPEWVLYEILLKSGLEIAANSERMKGDTFSVAGGRLIVCLDDPVDEIRLRELIESGAEKIVCLDHAFRGNDALKANIAQQVKQWNSHHPEKPVDFRTV